MVAFGIKNKTHMLLFSIILLAININKSNFGIIVQNDFTSKKCDRPRYSHCQDIIEDHRFLFLRMVCF